MLLQEPNIWVIIWMFVIVLGIIVFIIFSIVKSQQIKNLFRRINAFFKIKRLRFRIKSRLRRGLKLLKRHNFLSAYNLFLDLLENSKEFSQHKDLIELIIQYEQRALEELHKALERVTDQVIEKINRYRAENKIQSILNLQTIFFKHIKDYPETLAVKELREKVQQAHNDALIVLFQRAYDHKSLEIKNYLEKRQYIVAINSGKEFLDTFPDDINISHLNILKDNIYLLIQDPISQRWQKEYDRTIHETKNIRSVENYSQAIAKWEEFLAKSKEDNNISAVTQLREKAQKRFNRIREERGEFEREDDYSSLVSLALEHFYRRLYEKAIIYMDSANKILKEEGREDGKIFLKDTNVYVKNVEFKYLCYDKILELEINKLIRSANHLFRNGRESESREVLLEAQEMHTKFSSIFKRVEIRAHKQLIAEIRSGLNRVLEDKILSF